MKLKSLGALMALPLITMAAAAQPQPAPQAAAEPAPANRPAAPAGPPRLVIAISVDQFSTDLFQQYRGHFTGGLRRLADGIVFPRGFQAHAATETCPGHSTILTGSRPARTGIIANTWYDPGQSREDKAVYCAEDTSVPGATSRNYTVSVNHLRVPALGEYMRRANPASRTVAIAGKDRSAVMMAGRDPAEIWWWNGQTFVSHAGRAEPQTITRGNAAIARAVAQARPPRAVPAWCEARSRAVQLRGADRTVGSGRLERAAGDHIAFRASPDFDAAVLGLGARLREEMQLGEGQAPDLLILGLSASDYVGHTWGTEGLEMCLQLAGLDQALGEFFDQMDRTGIDYMVVLTSDHGGNDVPERQNEHAIPQAARVDNALNAAVMDRALAADLGLSGRVLYGDSAFGDMYVNTQLSPADQRRVLDEAVRRYRAHPQVAAVFTKAEIAATPMPSGDPTYWTLIERARASFDPERSGDFLVLLRPTIMPIAAPGRTYSATHGSPWDYDRGVPILFWRRGLTPFEQPQPVETVDILPTLAGVLGIPIAPNQIDGRCLDLIEGSDSSCPPSR